MNQRNNQLLKIAGAVILILVSIIVGIGSSYVRDLKMQSDRTKELVYIQEGDIRLLQQGLITINGTLVESRDQFKTALDSVSAILTAMDAKLRVLEGY